jgi:hypothetical protein
LRNISSVEIDIMAHFIDPLTMLDRRVHLGAKCGCRTLPGVYDLGLIEEMS